MGTQNTSCEICGKQSVKHTKEFGFLCKDTIRLCNNCSKGFDTSKDRKCAMCQMEDDIVESEKESAIAKEEMEIEEEKEISSLSHMERNLENIYPMLPAKQPGSTLIRPLINMNDAVRYANNPDGPVGIVIDIFSQTSEAIIAWPGAILSSLIKKLEHMNALVRVEQGSNGKGTN